MSVRRVVAVWTCHSSLWGPDLAAWTCSRLDIMPKMRTQFGVLFLIAQWVVYSDAWFWSWTGSTTLAPTVDHEGSGSPPGSGEQLTEDRVGAEITDEGHGIQKMVQTWDETTEAPPLTTLITTTQLENDWASEKGTAEIPSLTSKPGNGTSSVEGMGSEGSNHFKFTGYVSGHGPELESKLVLDSGSGVWSGPGFESESGFVSGAETSSGLGFKTQGFSVENQQGEVIPSHHRGLDSGGGVASQTDELNLKFQKSPWNISNRTDKGHDLGHIKSEQNLDVFVKAPDNTSKNTKIQYSHENSTPGDLLTLVLSNDSVETTPLLKNDQLIEVTQLSASKSTAVEVLQTSHASFVRQSLSTTQTPTHSQEMLISQLHYPTTISMATQPQATDSSSATIQTVSTSQMSHILDATQTSVIEQEPSQVALFSQTGADSQAPAESYTEVAKSALVLESPQCLLLESALPFCSSMVGERFAVPNHLNQSSVEDIQALLNEWAWLLRSHCHHSLEWFFCLLLVPKCDSLGPLPVLPCRSFCEVLRDSCWTLLDEGHLPVECHTLPDEEDDGYQCLSVSNWKGNQWFKRILVMGFILNHFSTPLLPTLSGVFNHYTIPSNHAIN